DRRTWLASTLVCVASAELVGFSGAAGAWLAVLFVALAAVGWGLDNNGAATPDTLTPSQITFPKGLRGGLLNLSRVPSLERHSGSLLDVGAAIAIGMLGYGISIVLYIRGAQALGAARSQMIFATAPFVGALVAWTALREPLTPAQGLAFAVMGLG